MKCILDMFFGDDEDMFNRWCLIDIRNNKILLVLVVDGFLVTEGFIAKDAGGFILRDCLIEYPFFNSSQH